MAPLTRLPAFFVFPRKPLEAEAAAAYVAQQLHASSSLPSAKAVVVLLDQVLEHARGALQQQLQQKYQVCMLHCCASAHMLCTSQYHDKVHHARRITGRACHWCCA
jgi:hypothetical protein